MNESAYLADGPIFRRRVARHLYVLAMQDRYEQTSDVHMHKDIESVYGCKGVPLPYFV